MLGAFRMPFHVYFSLMNRAVTKIKIDQVLIRNTYFLRHGLEIGKGYLECDVGNHSFINRPLFPGSC